VAVDGAGNLFTAGSGRIRKVFPNGIIITVAGGMRALGDAGPATNAQLRAPTGVAMDSTGNLFIADTGNQRIRRVSPDGIITTVAGNGAAGFSGDGGLATKAQLSGPSAIAIDATGNLFIADTGNRRIRKVSRDGIIATLAGNGTTGFSGDGGPAVSAQLSHPNSVSLDGAGNLLMGDSFRIRKVSLDGIITTIPGTAELFAGEALVAMDRVDNLFAADSAGGLVLKFSPTGTVTTVTINVGAGAGLAADSAGNLFVADWGPGCCGSSNAPGIYKLSIDGTITVVAGGGSYGYSADGTAKRLELGTQTGMAVDSAGNVYFSEAGTNLIRALRPWRR
jgi:hypothetical protein